MKPTAAQLHIYEVRPRKDHRGVDLISDGLPFGRLRHAGPDAVANAIGYAVHRSRSHDAVIRVYDKAGNVIETHEHKGDSKSGSGHADRHGFFSSQSFWKRGSLRSGSQKGLRRRSAFVSPPGTCSR